ncbi:(deoxy)nucleoside triphosphate pyrophosphohydrolase [Algivirga pacifica]|uniref:8-oxo-dGTP diphosphatase n=1 Tax=Algivirga pacifica TaxID=1162670 RepID=A0ABP9CZ83_9BACT
MKYIEVVAAIIRHKEKYLCVQRGVNKYPYISHKYEFPGGKIEKGESHQQALRREIQEELLMDIEVKEHLHTVEHRYPDFTIKMYAYLCTSANDEYTLTEHIHGLWLSKNELERLDWAAADIPIVQGIMRSKG